MPKVVSIVEIRFVAPEYAIPNGYRYGVPQFKNAKGQELMVVGDPDRIRHYSKYFEDALVRARDQAKLCAEHGHEHELAGCRTMVTFDGESLWSCESMIKHLESDRQTPERTLLVKVTIPV